MRYQLLFCTFFFCSFLFSPQGWSQQFYTYQGVLSGVKTLTKWIIADTDNKIEISGQNRGNEIKLEYTPTFDLQLFIEKEPDTSLFEVQRDGSQLSIKNRNVAKTIKIGSTPWIQEFKFGFTPFLKSTARKIDFVIVYKKNTSIHEMVATKEKLEKLLVGEKKYDTQKLKITLRGFKKRFWKAEVWYDTKTNILIKYRANEGPGTPHTEVTLVQ